MTSASLLSFLSTYFYKTPMVIIKYIRSIGNPNIISTYLVGINFCGYLFLRVFIFAGIYFCGYLFLRVFIFAGIYFCEFSIYKENEGTYFCEFENFGYLLL